MNRSLAESGEVLVISQFTLYGDTARGRRPSWIKAASRAGRALGGGGDRPPAGAGSERGVGCVRGRDAGVAHQRRAGDPAPRGMSGIRRGVGRAGRGRVGRAGRGRVGRAGRGRVGRAGRGIAGPDRRGRERRPLDRPHPRHGRRPRREHAGGRDVSLHRRRPPALHLRAGLATHVGLSLGWGAVLGVLLPSRRTVAWGALAGLGIAMLDLAGVGRRFKAVAALPTAPQVADHLLFGATVGWWLSRGETPRRAGLRGRGTPWAVARPRPTVRRLSPISGQRPTRVAHVLPVRSSIVS